MTLILSCMTHEHTLQVSDRRLINVRTGRLISNKTNKAVLVCGHFGFGYTGVAKLENEDVDEWLTRVLSDSALKGPKDSMEALRVRATEAVRQLQSRLSPQERRVAFVGAGWNRPPSSSPATAYYCHRFKFLWRSRRVACRSERRIQHCDIFSEGKQAIWRHPCWPRSSTG